MIDRYRLNEFNPARSRPRLVLISVLATALYCLSGSADSAQTLFTTSSPSPSNPLVTSEPTPTTGVGANHFYSSSARNFRPTQTLTTTTSPDILSNANSARYSQVTFASRPITSQPSQTTLQQQQQQPKSLKFTLIAGKYWKFNIKTNSLQTSHREKELRLHRNVSTNNFIIDDDGWFQYNHLQQQLFAWPSLGVKPATYYFVLLPSGLDYEADGENVINDGDVVATIVVELIWPYTANVGTANLNVAQLVDHEFSLDYLHRHSSYPLLLTQIASIFDILASKKLSSSVTRNISNQNLSFAPSQTTSTPATTTLSESIVSAASQPGKQTTRASSSQSQKLAEFLLIDSSATQDGEFFSITWTTQPALVNNTIVSITECRLPVINDTLARLSSRSVLYPAVENKFVVSYALEGPLVNSRAIIPTERGNYALRLSLLTPCRDKRVLDELGVTSTVGFPIDVADERENSIPEETKVVESSTQQTNPLQVLSTSLPNIDFVPSATATTTEQTERAASNQDAAVSSLSPLAVTETYQQVVSTPKISVNRDSELPSDLPKLYKQIETSTSSSSSTTSEPDQVPARPAPPSGPPENEIQPDTVQQTTTTKPRRALETTAVTAAPPPILSVHNNQQHQLPKLQPQAKSFANFLDLQKPSPKSNATMSLIINETPTTTSTSIIATNTSSNASSLPVDTAVTSNVGGGGGQETSLNDDLIGILNEIMDFMVSIAVPAAIFLGVILIASILIAICNLCMKKRKSRQFEVGDRFKFRYGSERKGFLKKSSKPVILEADQKSLSLAGTPLHKPVTTAQDGVAEPLKDEEDLKKAKQKDKKKSKGFFKSGGGGGTTTSYPYDSSNFFAMSLITNSAGGACNSSGGFSGGGDCGGFSGGGDCGGFSGGGDCGGFSGVG